MVDAASGSDALRGTLPGILSRAKVVISPYPFGLSDDDNIRITSVNAVAGVAVEIHYRLLTKEGEVKAGRFQHTPNSNRTAKTQDFNMAGGFVTNLTVFATAGAPLIGQTFVIVQLIRGFGSVAIVLGTMLQGYVTTTQALGWPGSAIISSTDGEPVVRTIIGTTPAVGVDIAETVPTGARWELLTVRAPLTLGAGGIASPVRLQIDDGTNVYAEGWTPNAGGASTVSPVTFSQNVQQQTSVVLGGTSVVGPLTGNRMLAGHRFTIHTAVNPTAVQWSPPVYNVREWQEAG